MLQGIAILFLLIFVVGCGSLPEKTQEAASRSVERAEVQEETLSSESAVEVPRAITAEEGIVQENISEEVIAEVPTIETQPIENIPPPSSTTHTVNLIDGGFDTPELLIKVGDTVVWQNLREGYVKKALIVGSSPCTKIKSSIFMPGGVYKYTFTEARTCLIADGIFTTQTMKVVVE